jgi:hypothetical protein
MQPQLAVDPQQQLASCQLAKAVLYSVTSSNKQTKNTTSERCNTHPVLLLLAGCGATACRHKA